MSKTSSSLNSNGSQKRSVLHFDGVIKFQILLRLAYRNLIFKKLRTTLTVLGVVIGIGSIVFLVSFGLGLQDLVSRQVVGSESVQTIDVTSPRSKVLKLNPDIVTQIEGYTGVDEVTKTYNSAGKIKYNSSQLDSVIYGVQPGYIKLSSLKFMSGDSKKSLVGGVYVNSTLLNAIGIDNAGDAIGKKVSVSYSIVDPKSDEKRTVTKDLPIIAVIESEPRAEVFVDYKLFEDEGMTDANQLKVVVSQEDLISSARKAIEAKGFTTTSPIDTLNQINQVFRLLQLVLVGFGGIGMIIAILGMFNTLTISLLERTREIGLMISLGARRQDVRQLFIVEALMLSVVGSIGGIIGAWIFGTIGNFVLNSFARQRGVTESVTAFIIVPRMIIITLALSFVLGLLVVYFPARRAAQTDPIEALRND